jgi:hypothetical protein
MRHVKAQAGLRKRVEDPVEMLGGLAEHRSSISQ